MQKKFHLALWKNGIIAFSIIFISSLAAQNEGVNFSGYIYDIETNEPIVNAAIQILDLNRYEVANLEGKFIFKKIPTGKHKIRITHLAYKEGLFDCTCHNDSTHRVFFLTPKSIKISTITVTEHNSQSKFDNLRELSNVLKGKELQKDLGITLASTLKNETGIAMRTMGPAPARPIIRGLGSDRVLMSEDGMKTTDMSGTSPDHAVTIEPFTIDRIEVIRGPKVLLQTPTTIGGVVNVIRNEIPEELHNSVNGFAGAYGETVNRGFLGGTAADIPINSFAVRAELSSRKTDDINTPIGILKNSYSKNINMELGTSYIGNFGFAGASFRRFDLDYGVPGGFVGAHPHGVNITMKRYQINLKTRINIHGKKLQHIKAHLSRVYYRHKEFEGDGALGAEFEITNYLGNVNFDFSNILFPSTGILGISFEARNFNVGGFVFTPPSTSLNTAVYLFETFTLGNFSFEVAGRYNYDKIRPAYNKPDASIGNIRKRIFNTYSFSLSTLYSVTKHVNIGINVNKSSRVPTIEELYSEGPHLAAYSYEIGNPDLKDESGTGIELFIYHKFNNIYFNINLFRNNLEYYIFHRNTGVIDGSTLLMIYKAAGEPALFYGTEVQFEWKFYRNFSFEISTSYTNGSLSETGKPLPQIPPLKGIVGFNYSDDILTLGITGEWAATQNRVDEFEKPTAGYFVFNAFGQYSISYLNFIHTVSLSLDNILNTEYRNHLSRVKSIMPEAGTNLRLTYKLYFH